MFRIVRIRTKMGNKRGQLTKRYFSSSFSLTDQDMIPPDASTVIQEYASLPQKPVSLLDLMNIHTTTSPSLGRLGQQLAHERTVMHMADLLQKELPVRLAHRIQDLDSIPGLREMPSVKAVKKIYISSFFELLETPPADSPKLEQDFGRLLQDLYQKHSNILLQMARGVVEYKRHSVMQQQQQQDDADLAPLMLENEDFLNRFYMSRVGIRVLAGQYLSLRHQLLMDKVGHIPSTYVGMICNDTSPYDVVQRAIQDASLLCERQFGEAPHVEVSGCLDLTFCYIPTHLHYILLELLKNAMRATMEFHQGNTEKPPVTVIIANGHENEDVILKIMDEGGGIPRSQIQHIWSYLFTTASPKIQQQFFESFNAGNAESGAVLAGLGYGLPLSRAYARYFGGELDLMSMEGYGTDAFCHLVRLGDKASMPV